MKQAVKRYQEWLNHEYIDEETKQELLGISEESKEIAERFFGNLSFGTGGLRGIIGAGTNRMNRYTVRKASLGLAHYLLAEWPGVEHSVVIAYDCRHQSPEFALETALALAEVGIKAYVYPALRSTPQLSYSVRQLGASAGVMITASHNPPEYNGYKVYGNDGAQLNLDDANQVIAYVGKITDELAIPVMEKEEALAKGLLVYLDEQIDQAYTDYVASLVIQKKLVKQSGQELRIVFTPLHGTAYQAVDAVFAKTGFSQVTYVREQVEADPNFSTVDSPNPEEHAAFQLAIEYAKKVDADIIMGTDPDADRMGLAVKNAQGEYQVLTGNQTGALLLEYIITNKQKEGTLLKDHTVCKTIVTSEIGRAIATYHGLETIDTLTGFKFIGEKIKQFKETKERSFLFGYEESYGYLYGDEVRDKDAIQAVLLCAELALAYKLKGLSVYEALQGIYQKYGFYREGLISLTLKGLDGLEKIRKIMQGLRDNAPHKVGAYPVEIVEDYLLQTKENLLQPSQEQISLPKSDVLKYWLEDGSWLCVRPSGTEPKLKIYLGIKAESNQQAEEKLAKLEEAFMQEIDRLNGV